MTSALALFVRLIKTAYGRTLGVFLTVQLCFLIFAVRGELPSAFLFGGVDQALTAFLLISVHLLVMVNTIIFFSETFSVVPRVEKLAKLDARLRGRARQAHQTFVISLVGSVFLSGGLALFVFLALLNFVPSISWAMVLELNDGLCVLLFYFFLLADNCCLAVCNAALERGSGLTTSNAKEVGELLRKVRRYTFVCDGPGLLGIVVIFTLSSVLHPMVSGFYWCGFVAGAIGLHIAFSQTALAMLGVMKE